MGRNHREVCPISPQGDCFACNLFEQSEWQVLNEKDRERLDNAKRVFKLGKGGMIFNQGDACEGIYCVHSGTVALRKTDENGNTVLLSLIHEGQTLGIRSYFAGSDYQASAEALTPVTLCQIPRSLLEKLLNGNPKLDMQFLRHISLDLAEARETILTNTSLTVRARMANLLLSLRDRYGDACDGGEMVLEIPMNRHDMAELLATRPETVARTITALARDGVVHFSGRQATIHDLEQLRMEASGSPS